MIAKGTTHNNGVKLASYMTTGKSGERAELWQLRGFASADIKDAFRSVHVTAAATRCEKPFFHVQVRNPEGENLTRAQWERVADRIESKLGYTDQPRAIAFHRDERTGHEHMHIAWSRIDTDSMRAEPLPFFKLRLKEVCREMENELDLTRVKNERDTAVRAASRDQEEQGRRLGVDVRSVRQTIRDCWERSDNGASFQAALADEGLILARGDRRDYVVIDHEGGTHALGKRILGTTAADTRARMIDINRAQLPTIQQVRDYQVKQRETALHISDRRDGGPSLQHEEALETRIAERAQSAPTSARSITSDSNEHEIGKAADEFLEATPVQLAGAVTGLTEAIDESFKILGGIASLLGDNKPPPPQTKEEAQARKDAAVSRSIDFERMLHDRAYRREIEQQDRERQTREERTLYDEYQQTRQRY